MQHSVCGLLCGNQWWCLTVPGHSVMNIFTTTRLRWGIVLLALCLWAGVTASVNQQQQLQQQSYQDGAEYSLSELTVLLPYTSARARVKYQLHARAAGADQGCFRFKSMNTDIILTEPIYDDNNNNINNNINSKSKEKCARTVSISVAPGLSGFNRVSTFVVAEDLGMFSVFIYLFLNFLISCFLFLFNLNLSCTKTISVIFVL